MPGKPDQPTTTVSQAGPRPPSSLAARPRPGVLIAIGAGGALGSVARYEIALAAPTGAGAFPWATLWINITGSLALGLLLALVMERWPPTRYVRPFAGIGVCGGYTTWSTFMAESALLVRDSHAGTAVTYLAISVIAGLAATYGGIWLGRLWPVERKRRST